MLQGIVDSVVHTVVGKGCGGRLYGCHPFLTHLNHCSVAMARYVMRNAFAGIDILMIFGKNTLYFLGKFAYLTSTVSVR